MDYDLNELFTLLAPAPDAESVEPEIHAALEFTIIAGLYSSAGLDLSVLPETARWLFELSVNAFDAIVHAWMSELPIQAATVRFGRKVLAAANRNAADTVAADRGDADTLTVLDAARKVRREVDRLRGFLRFNPNEDGVYIARCEPDHFSLPALCDYFTRRFGDASWVIIDEKRRCCLRRMTGERPRFHDTNELPDSLRGVQSSAHEWEQLWRHYHKTINNENRNNPALQRRFMPKRYWKYLPEL
jgi:probable DNA metabolism protein